MSRAQDQNCTLLRPTFVIGLGLESRQRCNRHDSLSDCGIEVLRRPPPPPNESDEDTVCNPNIDSSFADIWNFNWSWVLSQSDSSRWLRCLINSVQYWDKGLIKFHTNLLIYVQMGYRRIQFYGVNFFHLAFNSSRGNKFFFPIDSQANGMSTRWLLS